MIICSRKCINVVFLRDMYSYFNILRGCISALFRKLPCAMYFMHRMFLCDSKEMRQNVLSLSLTIFPGNTMRAFQLYYKARNMSNRSNDVNMQRGNFLLLNPKYARPFNLSVPIPLTLVIVLCSNLLL